MENTELLVGEWTEGDVPSLHPALLSLSFFIDRFSTFLFLFFCYRFPYFPSALCKSLLACHYTAETSNRCKDQSLYILNVMLDSTPSIC